MSPFERSERYREFCRKAASNWPVGADYFVLSEDEEAFARVHSPKLVDALWRAYEALARLSGSANFAPQQHEAGCDCAYHEAMFALGEIKRFDPPSRRES